MNKCSYCSIHAQSFLAQCPLCNRELPGCAQPHCDEALYPKYKNKTSSTNLNIRTKFFALTSVFVILVCLIINLLTWQSAAWFVWAASSIAYGWLLLRHTLLAGKNMGEKILAQLACCSLLLTAMDFSDGKPSFILNFLLPFLCIISIVMINVVTYKKQTVWKQYLGYQLKVVLISLIPMILYFAGLINVLWPSLAAAFISAITILAMLVFYNKQYANEMKKRFYL